MGKTWRAGAGLLAVLMMMTMASLAGCAVDDGTDQATEVIEVERVDAAGRVDRVNLPDEIVGTPGTPVHTRYRWAVDLGPQPVRIARTALYAPGLRAGWRLALNGHLLVDELGPAGSAAPPRPRAGAALRLVELPAALLQPGVNHFELEVAGEGWTSLSRLWLGDRELLRQRLERKSMSLVTGPVIVATMLFSLGLGMLVLWLRQRHERAYAFFGLGALLWGAHTLWTVAPRALLPEPHQDVWWTTLYAAMVTTLVLFALRFAQRAEWRLERALLGALAVVPAALYACAALGVLHPATEVLRLGLVGLAFCGLGVVAHHAWYRRSVASALFVLAGAVSAGFGLRDWLAFREGSDNFPVPLTPYAGAPFMLLVGTILLDRFVRTARALDANQQRLEQRVALREAELAESFQRMVRLERQQVAVDERQRILRELHDGLGAKLVQALTRVESAELDHQGLALELRDCLADMRLATEALAPVVSELGAAIANFLWRWQGLMKDAGLQAHWQVDLPEPGLPVPPYVALQLLRLMQEALTNVLRHAEASRVRLSLGYADGLLSLQIDDDGRGMGPSGAAGRGLARMRVRAEALGAKLSFGSPPGGGTRVQLEMPMT